MEEKKKYGGARPGSGRKKGVVSGKRGTTSSLRLKAETWQKLDRIRGSVSRSRFIGQAIDAWEE